METKQCPSCGKDKNRKEFNKCRSKSDGLQTECKICKRQRDLDHYHKNKAAYRKRRSERQKKYRGEVDRHKEECGCLYCGENEPCCLDLHHNNDDKEGTVANLIADGLSWERIWNEVQKCEVVCASCHRKLHAGKLK